MENRLTEHHIYPDGQHGYEALGHDAYSQRPFIEITKKLALYEDTGYTPEEVKQLKTNLLGNTADDWMGMYNVAAERAIKAEAEVERLKLMVKSITGGLDECMETVHFLEAENAKLQLTLKKACDMLPACPDELGRLDDMFLRAAEQDLRELEG